MPAHTDSPARPWSKDKALAQSYQKIAEALQEFSQQVEYMRRAGVLTQELRDVARDIRTPVTAALMNFQRAVHPEDRMGYIHELRRYGVKV